MFGSVIGGALSDKFGRKPIFLLSQWAMVIVGVANAFAPNYYVFAVLRFFTGILQQVILRLSFIFISLFGSNNHKHREDRHTIVGLHTETCNMYKLEVQNIIGNKSRNEKDKKSLKKTYRPS